MDTIKAVRNDNDDTTWYVHACNMWYIRIWSMHVTCGMYVEHACDMWYVRIWSMHVTCVMWSMHVTCGTYVEHACNMWYVCGACM